MTIVLAEIGFITILIITVLISYNYFHNKVQPKIHRNNCLIEYKDKILGDILIKPCPYCGNIPKIEKENEKIKIKCKAKDHITITTAFNAEDAITHWNNRDFIEDVSIL